MDTVLFLCTGNYDKSRFAEEYFNHRAILLGAGWRADSRGLTQNMIQHNVDHFIRANSDAFVFNCTENYFA